MAIQKTVTKNGIRLLTQGKYCSENIEVRIDGASNIIPSNIAENINIAGVTGTMRVPSGTINITSNIAQLDVANYKYASVSVGQNATVLSIASDGNCGLDIFVTKAETSILSPGTIEIR